jgi:hypothetical protein
MTSSSGSGSHLEPYIPEIPAGWHCQLKGFLGCHWLCLALPVQ